MNFIEKQMEATVFHLNQISLIDSDLAEGGSVFLRIGQQALDKEAFCMVYKIL